LAIILGKRLLEENRYDTIIVSGADIMTNFVVSGFQSFKAVSNEVCKPYDASRDGISLGEACGTIVLTNDRSKIQDPQSSIIVKGGASSNDANHISGPSRTGEGLILAIEKTLVEAKMNASEIDFISGHGTATLYNDEMESQAISTTNLQDVPMNSLKSYFGHTLGAAGIIESIIGIHSMKNNTLIGTYNYKEPGVTKPVNIIKETTEKKVNNCLKTAAGFGGCNAAVLFVKG
jgi:3-oxoacyl-[acyl-carrier-protein] synthase-1